MQLRRYPGWLRWLCAGLCIVCGSFCSIAFKWQNLFKVRNCESCEVGDFKGAVYQTQLMFIGEGLSLLIYYVDKWLSGRQGKAPWVDFVTDARVYERAEGPFYVWFAGSTFDFVSTIMLNIATQITYAATVQMLKNFMVVVTALAQIVILRKAVRIHEWIGVCIITLALVLTAVPAIQSPDTSINVSTGKTVLGVALAVIGTSLQAVQLLVEEWFFRRARSSPFRAVGWEGVSGSLYCLVAWPIIQKTKMEDVTGSWYAALHTKGVSIVGAVYVPAALLFNASGAATTLLGSGLLRSVCYSVRAPLVWLVSLAVHWQSFEYWSLASALVFCVGFAVYINKIGYAPGHPVHRWLARPVPCFCTKPEKDVDYEEFYGLTKPEDVDRLGSIGAADLV